MKNKDWGGYRVNSGRKRKQEILAKDRTKVVRISLQDSERIKKGIYDQLIQLLYDYRLDVAQNPKSKSPPRYVKLRQLLKEVEEVLGGDFESWV